MISVLQRTILIVVDENPGIGITRLGKIVGIFSHSVRRRVNELTDEGYITIQKSPHKTRLFRTDKPYEPGPALELQRQEYVETLIDPTTGIKYREHNGKKFFVSVS